MKTSDDGSVRRVLVVEDEPVICKVCRGVLSAEGFEVDIAVNGREAQDAVRGKHYDLCLLDLRMPEMGGRELYEWLRKEKPELVKRVIFISGDTMSGDTEVFLQQSGRPFLPKPFDATQLVMAVREALK